MTMTATEPAYTTPEGGAVYLTDLPALRGIRFYEVDMFDENGELIATFPSMGEGHLALIAAALNWKLVP